MENLVTALVCVAIFGALYAAFHRRQRARGSDLPVRWEWLAAIVGLAAIVLVLGVVVA